ncbi:MAG: hypothetical protein H8E42_09230 [Nitrospinae bacterium]|nr:hypothetical protein [Nitrospinota bacterium]MBL7020708.1 hypothetical protein [Nitrospinaceae bacterium]
MNLNLFQAITPWISLLLLLGLGTIGWLIRWMLAENLRRFLDFKENLEEIEGSLRDLERIRQDDQKYHFEQYVDKKAFYVAVGKNEALISRIFKQLNELAKSVNQIVGALNAGENRNV